MSNFREIHQAICDNCSAVASQSDSGTFIDRFFLPDMCKNCGEYPEWQHRVIVMQRVPRERSLFKPWTWVLPDRWVESARDQWRA